VSAVVKHYAWTYVALLALTTLALGTTLLPLGSLGIALGVGIAIAKSLLIVLFFMHLIEHRTSSALALLTAVLLLVLLVGLSALDVVTRSAPGPTP